MIVRRARTMGAVVLGLVVAAFAVTKAAWADGNLQIYDWTEYLNPRIVEKFAKTYDIKVTVDDYQSNEQMLATVRAGNAGYDIVVPSDFAVQLLIEEGLLAETKPNEMENFKNVDPRWKDVFWDPGRAYSVPNLWGTVSLAVDTARYSGDIDSLKLMFDPPPELQGRIGVIKLPNDVINAALRYLGKPRCNNDPNDLASLTRLLMNAKRNWRWISYYLGDAMAAGDLSLVYYWNNPVPSVRQTIPTLQYVYPREGFSGWMDNVVVLKAAPNLENAKLFQNFMMDAQIAALNSEYNNAANAILGSEKFLPEGFKDMPEIKLPPGREPEFVPRCSSEVRDKYDAIWAEVAKE